MGMIIRKALKIPSCRDNKDFKIVRIGDKVSHGRGIQVDKQKFVVYE